MKNKICYLLYKLRQLRYTEWRDLFSAQGAIISAQMSVWLKRRGSLVSAESRSRVVQPDKPVEASVLELARAIDRAASFGLIRAQCLVRSIALARLLGARGYNGAAIRVGVSRKSDKILAHAWVEYNGIVVGDREDHVSQFDQLSGIDVDARGVT